MSLAIGTTALALICATFGVDGPSSIPTPPPLKSAPEPINPLTRKPKHYLVQIKLIEVDGQGRETVLGEPQLQTAGGNAGISIEHADGRHFEFTVRLTDRSEAGDELMPAKINVVNTVEGLQKKLDRKIDLNIQQQPLREVLREIGRRTGIVFAIDPEISKSIAREIDASMNVTVKDEVVSDVLDRLLQPAKLGYLVKNDLVLIAAYESLIPAPDELTVKTYDVADLVKTQDADGRESVNIGPLIERIKSTIQPMTWNRKESTATIRPFNSTYSIVVRQTAQAHSAIERLLDRIRREPKLISE